MSEIVASDGVTEGSAVPTEGRETRKGILLVITGTGRERARPDSEARFGRSATDSGLPSSNS